MMMNLTSKQSCSSLSALEFSTLTSPAHTHSTEKLMPAKKKQGYSARLDERLGMTRGKQATKKMSAAGRRKVSKATRKPKGTYGFKAKKK